MSSDTLETTPIVESLDSIGEVSRGGAVLDNQTSSAPADPRDALLLILADQLDDIEKIRIAGANRIFALREVKGLGDTKAEQKLVGYVEMWEQAEHQAILDLQRAMRAHPLGKWVKGTVGLGEKQAARLIAAIGDPLWNHAEDRPRRGPAELWAYCGYAPGQKRTKGVRDNWNGEAKMRARLCAESCIKHRHSPYREVYDDARASWEDKETSDLHKHNHALRRVAKAILKDLWRAARAIQEPDSTQATREPAEANVHAAVAA